MGGFLNERIEEAGGRLRVGSTPVLECPTGETVGNRKRKRQTSFAADAKAAAHGGAPPTRKDVQFGAGARRVVPTEHGVGTTVDVTTEEREQAEAASAEGRQCEARPSRVQRVADFAAWAEKVTEGGEGTTLRRAQAQAPTVGRSTRVAQSLGGRRRRHRRCARARNDGAARGGSDGRRLRSLATTRGTTRRHSSGGWRQRRAARAVAERRRSRQTTRRGSDVWC